MSKKWIIPVGLVALLVVGKKAAMHKGCQGRHRHEHGRQEESANEAVVV